MSENFELQVLQEEKSAHDLSQQDSSSGDRECVIFQFLT